MFEFYLRDHGLLFPNGIGEEFAKFLGMHQEITPEPHVVTPALAVVVLPMQHAR